MTSTLNEWCAFLERVNGCVSSEWKHCAVVHFNNQSKFIITSLEGRQTATESTGTARSPFAWRMNKIIFIQNTNLAQPERFQINFWCALAQLVLPTHCVGSVCIFVWSGVCYCLPEILKYPARNWLRTISGVTQSLTSVHGRIGRCLRSIPKYQRGFPHGIADSLLIIHLLLGILL